MFATRDSFIDALDIIFNVLIAKYVKKITLFSQVIETVRTCKKTTELNVNASLIFRKVFSNFSCDLDNFICLFLTHVRKKCFTVILI